MQPTNSLAFAFFSRVFGDSLEDTPDAQIVLWRAKGRRSWWASSLEEAAEIAEREQAEADIYFGCSLQDKAAALEAAKERHGEPRSERIVRGSAATVRACPGVWLDIDFASGDHAKRDLPSTEEHAALILGNLPLSPTMVVRTGGGLHAYWLLHEPLVFESGDEREFWARAVCGWNMLAKDISAAHGYQIDSTWDMSRVLRPAGTVNHKYGTVVEVCAEGEFDASESNRYNPSDFEEWAVAELPTSSSAKATREGTDEMAAAIHEMGAEAYPPPRKLDAMIELQPSFSATWHRRRDDLPSQSEYDLSLASFAASSGWTKEEIAALIIAHRRDGGEDLKLNRPDYYANIESKVKDRRPTMGSLSSRDGEGADLEKKKVGIAENLSKVSEFLNLRITRIVKYVGTDTFFRIFVGSGLSTECTIDKLTNSKDFRNMMAALTGRLIETKKQKEWDPVAQMILDCCEVEHVGSATPQGVVSSWMREYFKCNQPIEKSDGAFEAGLPFFHEGGVSFFPVELQRFLKFNLDDNSKPGEVARMLQAAGCRQHEEAGEFGEVYIAWNVPGELVGSSVFNRQSEAVL